MSDAWLRVWMGPRKKVVMNENGELGRQVYKSSVNNELAGPVYRGGTCERGGIPRHLRQGLNRVAVERGEWGPCRGA